MFCFGLEGRIVNTFNESSYKDGSTNVLLFSLAITFMPLLSSGQFDT